MRIPLLCLFTIANLLQAQVPDLSGLQSLKPRAIGPASMSGRVTSIAVLNSDPNYIFIGTASGGLWKSVNGGLNWEAVFDKMDVASIGAVAIQQNNKDIVWAGTGEGNPRNSHNSGKGIYKSLDGGRTWKMLGLENTKTIHRILIDPQNPETVYVGAMGSIWGPTTERGVYKTTDGGATWQKILYQNDLTGCAELVMDPNNPNKIIASMYEYQRKPYTFYSGGKGSGLYMTVDGGKNWTRLGETHGLPSGILGRTGAAIAASNSNKMYALIESANNKLELYASENGGYNWKKLTDAENIGNRPFYYCEIYVDPKNENHIISIWSQVTHSIDGGKTWSILLDWDHVHPDHHALYIHPENTNLMMNGNDGGFNMSSDGGKTWRYISNLPVGQFYHINVDNAVPYHIYGGLQDNGSWRGPGFTWTEGGIRNSDWKELLFGDGFDVIPLRNNPEKGYAAWQGGNVYFYDLHSGRSQAVQPVHPEGKYLRFNWNAAMAAHPVLPNGLYYGSQFLHKSYNNGLSWKIISPDLTTNDTSKLHQEKSGGLTIDATNAENYCTIISIAPAPSDTNVIWVGTDDGNVQLTRDGGKTWSLMNAKIIGLPKNAWIPVIYVSKNNAGEAWVVANNYRQNDWQPYLFKTSDFGITWKRMADASKVSGHCLSVLQDPVEPRLVWLGTDHGLWVSFNGGENWSKWTHDYPSCPTQDIVLQETENDLVVGTFGRGIYVFDDITPFRVLASKNHVKKDLQIYAGTHGYLAHYTRPAGERFGADASFEGRNKPGGARITLFTAGTKNKKTNKWEKTKIQVYVYRGSSKIRSYEATFDSGGFYRIGWNLTQDGYRFPSHHKWDKTEPLPSGITVIPGKYKVVLQHGNLRDSVEVDVIAPSENPINNASEQLRSQMYNTLKTSVDRSFRAFEGLKDAEEMIKSITTLDYENDSAQKKLSDLSRPVMDSISALKLLFMQAKDVRYYEDITPRLNEKLYNAYTYILSAETPAGNADAALKNAQNHTEMVLQRVNRFFANDWKKFQLAVEQEKVKPFKKVGEY